VKHCRNESGAARGSTGRRLDRRLDDRDLADRMTVLHFDLAGMSELET
jgi:hypothetical protein